MTNNDIFRNMLHLMGLKDHDQLIHIFWLGGITATKSKIKGWRTSLDNPRASHMPDKVLQGFFCGLFEYRDALLDEQKNLFNFIEYKDFRA